MSYISPRPEQSTDEEIDLLTQIAGLSYQEGDLLYYHSGQLRTLDIGDEGRVLKVSGGLPFWGTGSSSLAIQSINGLTASSQIFTNDTNVTITSTSNSHTLGWSGTLPIARGGTGQSTKTTAFNALSPMTNAGDIIYGGASGSGERLAIGGANTVLHGGASVPSYSAVVEADITLSDNTTNNVSITKHGFAPTLPNLTTQFFRGDGAWAAPAGTTVPNAYLSESFAYTLNVAHNIVHNFGTYPVVQAFDTSGYMIVPLTIQNTDVNTVAVTFSTTATFTLVLTVGAPQLNTFVTTALDYAMTANDYIIEVSGAGKTVTLLTAVGRSGKIVSIKNISAADIHATGTGGETLEGVAIVDIPSGDCYDFYSNGTNWKAK